ncbi:hypothetical protein F4802DRAFT_352181 [Xylaria palmicola]|nr:hypothetical protein F4802DRAFT_352181 [Xylaria palmicola]
MHLIPPEILLQIFDYLDGPAPSEMRLHDQPSLELLAARPGWSGTPLKATSLVSRSWRCLALPYLFRHVLWRHDPSGSSYPHPRPLLRFLTQNCLAHHVVTVTMVVGVCDPDPASSDYRFTPPWLWPDHGWVWDRLFSVIDPLRFTILAQPTNLAVLLSRMLFLDYGWPFDMPYHILSLARTNRQIPARGGFDNSPESAPSRARVPVPPAASTLPIRATPSTVETRPPVHCPLFTIRPWTSLLLNEGSSAKVYRVYEFFMRRPPSVLGALLGCEEYPNSTSLIPQTIVDFNYIAVFPLSSHITVLVENLPRIRRLFVQLSPKPGSGILENTDEMKYIDPADLWMERDMSYRNLMNHLTFTNDLHINWGLLQVFESGDTADKEVWEMAVQYLDRDGVQDWRAMREGVFVKLLDDGESSAWTDEVNGHVGGFASTSNVT